MQVPRVTLEDLQAFQAAHFPGPHKPLIPPTTEPAQDESSVYGPEEDLGYYPDGVKRTLTDEQIRIFRHSEIHALLRARQLEEDDAEYEARRHATNDDGVEINHEGDTKAVNASVNTAGTKRRRSTGGRKPNTQRPQNAPSDLDYEVSTQDTTKPKPEKNFAYLGRKIVSYAD